MRTVLPPDYDPQPGRPKENKRKKRADEPQKDLTKLGKMHQKSLRCSVCGTLGHKKKSCKIPKTGGECDAPNPVPRFSPPGPG